MVMEGGIPRSRLRRRFAAFCDPDRRLTHFALDRCGGHPREYVPVPAPGRRETTNERSRRSSP